MTRFNTKWGAACMLGLATLYMVISLAMGHSAASEKPANLRASETSLDVWKACALLVREKGKVLVVDIRPKLRFDLYHLPGALNLADVDAKTVAQAAGAKEYILVVAEQEKDASALATELTRMGKRQVHLLKDGIQSWYLTFELPVSLFSDKPSPRGWEESMALVRAWLATHDARSSTDVPVLKALERLSTAGYEQSLLRRCKPPSPACSVKFLSWE